MVQFTKLRLAGFKSFVDPTELVIAPGMTGIVGPNGCGKSNLVEALKWVMGETSAKQMRGSEMDDVIFGGSTTRPARNLAEVSLTLDNSDRSAPSQFNDHEDLEVVRRIERGQGSNYKANGRDVRARDVQLLFADAATGAHSAALVSQGRVGAIINAKPTARRGLLEEAAGITGLHSRRHEAELRLRAAEANLERLDDVIATLESQLQGLKRQARQATRYRNLAQHIRRHEAILLHHESEAAVAAEAATKARHAETEARVAELTQSAAAAAREQSEAASQLPPLRQAEAEAGAALQRLVVERETLEREEARAVEAHRQAEQRLAQIDADRQRSQAQAEDAQAALERLAEEESALEAAAGSEAERLEAAREAQAEAEDKVNEGEALLDRESGEVASLEARANALERRLGEINQRLGKLRREAEATAAEQERLEAQGRDGVSLETLEARMNEAEATLERNREAAESAGGALSEAREGEQAARQVLQEAEKEQERLRAEIETLARMLEPAEADMWAPVIDAVRVQPGYEAALGAALGEDLNAPPDDAAPVHWHGLAPLADAPALPSGVQALASVVEAPAALARRLSQIGIVADTESGARLQEQLRPGQRLVTREGDLWRWDGFVVRAGAPTAAAARLEQRNRLAELRQAQEAAQPAFEAAQGKRAEAGEALRAAEAREREAREAVNRAITAAREARETHARESERTAAARQRRAALEETARRLSEEIAEAQEALEAAQAEKAGLADLGAARARVAELRADLAQRRRLQSERRGDVERLLRGAEARADRLQAIERESQSWQQRVEGIAHHAAELDKRRQEVAAEIETLAGRPGEIAASREALAEQISLAENKRKSAADALAEAESRQAEADKALKAQEAALGGAREDRVRAEAAAEQAAQALEALTQKVREKLDCGLDGILAAAEIKEDETLPARDAVEAKLERLVKERDGMGPVNLRAEQEAEELETQIEGMQSERGDLLSAIGRLRQGIGSLNKEGRERLLAAFETVNAHFSELFVKLFGGGRAHLALTEAEDPLEAGLEIMASPPGKRLQVLSLLSGGEQALTAVALLFAVFLTNPAPICVLDEVDAPLDDANVDRFCRMVDELSKQTKTRFLIITHHRTTMARVHRLFGVTMAERGVSKLVSVDLEAAESLRESA